MFIDILWYHNSKFIRSNDKIKIDINFEQCKTTCLILNVTNENVGFYQCKAINDVSEDSTRAKFEIASTTNKSSEIEETISQAETQQSQEMTETVITAETEVKKVEKAKKTVKHVAKKGVKKTPKATVVAATKQKPEKVIIKIQSKDKGIETIAEQYSSSTVSNVKVRSETYVEEEEDVEIREEVEEVHIQIYKEIISDVDIDSFKIGDEVNQILTSIEADKFGVGQMALRELATIGCLLRKGMTISDVINLYHTDAFPSLKIPESQAAMVQLVERHGHESLITEIFSEAAEDEHLLASTVGFRAFMRMIEIHEESFESIITKFRCEDFYSHEWKQSDCKEETLETKEGVFTSTEQRFTSGNC